MRNKMKALVTLLLCLVTVLAFGLLLTACGETDESGKNPGGGGEVVTPGGGEDNPGGGGDAEHTHTPDNVWHVDSTAGTHYHECTVCHEHVEEAAHVEETLAAVEATCTSKGKTAGKKCSVCDAVLEEQTETDMIAHTPGEEYFVGETGHYHKCTVCQTALEEEDHTPGATYIDGENGKHYQECTACNAKVNETAHTAGEDAQWQIEDDKHYHTCTACSARMDEATHAPSRQWYQSETGHFHKCVFCDKALEESPHRGARVIDGGVNWIDANQHSLKECTVCGKKDVVADHVYEYVSSTYGDPSKTYTYKCVLCDLWWFTYTRMDDGTPNYSVSFRFNRFAKYFREGSEEFTVTIPSSFTIDGEVKKVVEAWGDSGDSQANCKLVKAIYAEGITSIRGGFSSWPHLETVVIPEGATLTGDQYSYPFFRNNPKLTTIVVPKSLESPVKQVVNDTDTKPTAYFLGNASEWANKSYKDGFGNVKFYGTDWHWADDAKKDTPVDGAQGAALLPSMLAAPSQARKREI